MRRGWEGIFSHFAGMIGLLLIAVLSILGNPGKVQAVVPKSGGALTVGVEVEFRGFDPLKAVYLQSGDRSVIMAIEERLFGMDRKGNLVPELATSATPSEDGKTWTIKLREGVSYHDGTPFNADAVVDHWQRILAPANRYSGAAYIEAIESVKKIDDYTITFILKHPWAALMPMLSSSQWTAAFIPSPKSVRENTQNRAPVGTGPFIFKEWIAKDRLVVARNPNYWRKGLPYLDTVTFRPIPDIEVRFSGLLSGGTNVILTDSGSQILKAEKDRTLKVYGSNSSGPFTFIINTDKAPLNDVRVRRALAHAWNQDLYLKTVFSGTLTVARTPYGGAISCGDSGYREYDPAKARQLLADYGKPVALELLETNSPRGREAGELMKKLFNDVGVNLKLTLLPEVQQVRRVMAGDYDISVWRLMDLNDMGPYLNVCLHSKGKLNFSNYQNPAMDQLLEVQQQSTDEKTRNKALCGIANLINEDVMYLYGGDRRIQAIAKTSIQGMDPFDQGIVRVSEAWVKEEKEAGKVEKVEKAKKVKKPAKAKKSNKPKKLNKPKKSNKDN